MVKFDTKMYLNFSNFRARTSAGGDKPWSKNGDKCQMGGIGKIFAGWGDPPSPPQEKNPATDQKLACFAVYLKIVDTYFEK